MILTSGIQSYPGDALSCTFVLFESLLRFPDGLLSDFQALLQVLFPSFIPDYTFSMLGNMRTLLPTNELLGDEVTSFIVLHLKQKT